jgi:putative peptidoglycan lipid II flippase
MVVTLLASNILGLVRDRFLAQKIPTELLDTYFAAFRIPDLIFNVLILGALSAALIPLLTDAFRRDEAEAWRAGAVVLNTLVVGLTATAFVVALAIPVLVPVLVPSFDLPRQQLTAELARWLMVQPVLFGASYLVSGLLTARRRFAVYALAPLLYNLAIIVATVGFADRFQVRSVIAGVVVGAGLHLCVQLLTARAIGFRWQPTVDPRHPLLRRVVRLMLPRAVGLGGLQLVLVVFTAIASTLSAGSIAVYNFTDNIQTMPLAVFGISFATALFPTLADSFTRRDDAGFARYVIQGLRSILYLLVPSAIGLILLRAQIIRLILGSGYFDWAATILAALTLGWFSLGLVGEGVVHLLSRAFYARHDTLTPTKIAVVSYITMVVVGAVAARWLGVAGLALGFALGSNLQAGLLYFALRRTLTELRTAEPSLWSFAARLSVSVAVLVIVVQVAKVSSVALGADMTRFWGVLVQTVAAIGLGAVGYFVASASLGVREFKLGWQTIKARFSTIGQP